MQQVAHAACQTCTARLDCLVQGHGVRAAQQGGTHSVDKLAEKEGNAVGGVISNCRSPFSFTVVGILRSASAKPPGHPCGMPRCVMPDPVLMQRPGSSQIDAQKY
jgi:hypothetical protein